MICTRLRPGHLSVRVGDSSRRSEEIVKKSRIVPLNAIIIIIKFGPPPASCPVNRNVNDEESLPLVSVSKGCTSLLVLLFCFVLLCFLLLCFALLCFALLCFVLFCFVLFCFALFFVLFCFV